MQQFIKMYCTELSLRFTIRLLFLKILIFTYHNIHFWCFWLFQFLLIFHLCEIFWSSKTPFWDLSRSKDWSQQNELRGLHLYRHIPLRILQLHPARVRHGDHFFHWILHVHLFMIWRGKEYCYTYSHITNMSTHSHE